AVVGPSSQWRAQRRRGAGAQGAVGPRRPFLPSACASHSKRKPRCDMSGIVRTERVQVVVIGAGQAGLSVGYHLAQRGIQFVILEARERIGDSWRERWDSLRLF